MKILYEVGMEVARPVVQVRLLTGKAGTTGGGCSLGKLVSRCSVSCVDPLGSRGPDRPVAMSLPGIGFTDLVHGLPESTLLHWATSQAWGGERSAWLPQWTCPPPQAPWQLFIFECKSVHLVSLVRDVLVGGGLARTSFTGVAA